jgi:glycine/D-amino acid oxidase-like deaminating enzyme
MKHANFWLEDASPPTEAIASELPERADVAIIGSGYTGLHAALALREAGADVVVLDQQTIGWGASSRNGGMATAGLKLEMPTVFKRYGEEMGRAFWAWAQAAIDYVEETVRREQIDCFFSRSGHVTLAYKPEHLRHMDEEVKWFTRTLGHAEMWVVGQEELKREIHCRGYYGGQVDATSGSLHPARYVFGLARAAARRGACLVENAEVTAITRNADGFIVTTRKSHLSAKHVLLATNGYTTNLVRSARRGVFPAGSYIIVTERLSPALQDELSPRRRMFFDSKHFLNYFRLTPDGRMLFGGRHDLSTHLDLDESARLLRKRMVEVFPQLAHIPLSHTWTGQLGLTFDLMPHLGSVKGVWYAYGYAGHGVAVASMIGREVGEMIAGRRASSLFSQIPHRRHFFTPYDRLYLPLVSAWFRLLDRLF